MPPRITSRLRPRRAPLVWALLVWVLLVWALLTGALPVSAVAPASASPSDPATGSAPVPAVGDVITITLISDEQRGEQVVWFDSDNRLRYQSEVPLQVRDPETGLWSATLTYPARTQHLRTEVTFVSAGHYAGCTIWIGDVEVSSDEQRGDTAMAACR